MFNLINICGFVVDPKFNGCLSQLCNLIGWSLKLNVHKLYNDFKFYMVWLILVWFITKCVILCWWDIKDGQYRKRNERFFLETTNIEPKMNINDHWIVHYKEGMFDVDSPHCRSKLNIWPLKFSWEPWHALNHLKVFSLNIPWMILYKMYVFLCLKSKMVATA